MSTKWSEMLIDSKLKRQTIVTKISYFWGHTAHTARGHPITYIVASLEMSFFRPSPLQPSITQVMPVSSMNSSPSWSPTRICTHTLPSILSSWMNYLCIHFSYPLPPVPQTPNLFSCKDFIQPQPSTVHLYADFSQIYIYKPKPFS